MVSGTVTQDAFSATELQSGTLQIDGDFSEEGGTTTFYVGGSAPGLLAVSNSITLAGTLNLVPAPDFVGGNPLTVIDNTGASAITGYFDNLPQGTRFRLGDWLYAITYAGGAGGNDVVLSFIAPGQPASTVVNVSSEFNASPADYSAAQALGAPDVTAYGDNPKAWSPLAKNGTQETITLGYATAVYPQGVTIREVNGNGFVTRVDLIDTNGTPHTIWAGTRVNASKSASPCGERISGYGPTTSLMA